MANQSGWFLLNGDSFRVSWDGGGTPKALTIEYAGEKPSHPLAISIFGHGILTFYIRYLFRTPPGYNLWVRGPANLPKDGIHALEGVVETDWAVASFTMNWKLTRAGSPVHFERGEPFCMIVPRRRHELEAFVPRLERIEEEPDLAAQWQEFDRRRGLMNGLRRLAFRRAGQTGSDQVPWERHYFEGTSPTGVAAPEHQKKLTLRTFRGAGEAAEPEAAERAESGEYDSE